MTPTQKKFLEKIELTKQLHPEVRQAVKVLASEDLQLEELERLVGALLKAPEDENSEFRVGGIIRG